KIKFIEQERDVIRRDVEIKTRRGGEIRSQVSAYQARLEQIKMRSERLDKDIREAREQMEQEAEQLSEARMILGEAIDMMEQDTERRELLLSERESVRELLETARH